MVPLDIPAIICNSFDFQLTEDEQSGTLPADCEIETIVYDGSPIPSKRSHHVSFKLEVVEYSQMEGHSKSGAAKKFGVDKKCVRDWCKRKEDLKRMMREGLGAMCHVPRNRKTGQELDDSSNK